MDASGELHRRHLFDGVDVLNVYNTSIVNLSVGAPGPDLLKFCVPNMRKATEHRLKEEEKEGKYFLFQYGITEGLYECRYELAKFLSSRYYDVVDSKDLVLTCGASHGLQVLLCSVVSPNGIIFVEEVTYMIALAAFKEFPLMEIVTIPMKDDTVDVEAFERIVMEKKQNEYFLSKKKLFWAMFYTIPTYHNPTGMCIPAENCKQLVDIARKHCVLIACDDVYNLLHYGDSQPPQRLLHYDDPKDPDYKGGNIVSIGTFSKILSPAIRVGWLECGPRITNEIKENGTLKSGGAVNHYVSGIIGSLLHLGLQDEYVDLLVKTYTERLAALCDTLDRYLPNCCSYRRPNGGYFVWIRMPADIDGNHFIQWCQEKYRVTAIPGVRFSNTGESHNFLRLSIAFHGTQVIMEATQKLCTGLLEYIRNGVGENQRSS